MNSVSLGPGGVNVGYGDTLCIISPHGKYAARKSNTERAIERSRSFHHDIRSGNEPHFHQSQQAFRGFIQRNDKTARSGRHAVERSVF